MSGQVHRGIAGLEAARGCDTRPTAWVTLPLNRIPASHAEVCTLRASARVSAPQRQPAAGSAAIASAQTRLCVYAATDLHIQLGELRDHLHPTPRAFQPANIAPRE